MFKNIIRIRNIIRSARLKEQKKLDKYYLAYINRIMSENLKNIEKMRNEVKAHYEEKINKINEEHEEILISKDQEIFNLEKFIRENHSTYKSIRMREVALEEKAENMSSSIEDLVMKMHQITQPFFRVKGEIEAIKRISDRKDEKVRQMFKKGVV